MDCNNLQNPESFANYCMHIYANTDFIDKIILKNIIYEIIFKKNYKCYKDFLTCY